MNRPADHQTPESGQIVNFQFTDFVQTDYQGHETVEELPRRGYILFNDRRKDFGFGAFGSSDSYTIDFDVLNQIRVMHPNFMTDIVESGGLMINGIWHPVDGQGNLVKDE
jgi:hypothetical protein